MDGSKLSIVLESFESLANHWRNRQSLLKWDCLFMLPPWLQAWWQEFASHEELRLWSVQEEEKILGIAPLFLKGETASLMGSPDVCDYSDFIVVPGRENDFFSALLGHLQRKGIQSLSLNSLRPDSSSFNHLVEIARGRGYGVSCLREDVSLELELPSSWEAYLGILTQKQRHEVRRKLRRIREAGEIRFCILENTTALTDGMEIFMKLFRESREDKAAFLSTRREAFFNVLVKAMAQARLLRLGILEFNAAPIAAVLFFDYDNRIYLYNSGYDLRYRFLSAGLISKILCIRNSIERGRRTFDFLKGNEEYKNRLGGKAVPLYGCQISVR
jgi:CelD/BcsL family acetyltransferase involved in cellulose biosynthesis